MRPQRSAALFAALSLAGTMALFGQAVHSPQPALAAVAADTYSWKNVRIDGGGFVPGIVFNRTERNLVYARTDIGGAYRWNQAGQNWIPLLDWVGQKNWGYNGVYLGTNGRGILYADREGGPSTPTGSPSAPPSSPSAPPSSPSSPPPTATWPPPGGCTATYRVTNEWSNGFQGEVTVRAAAAAITGWTVTWTFPSGQTISQLWNGGHTQTGANVTVRNAAWNGALPPNGTTTVGFTGTRTGADAAPPTVSCART